MESIGPFSPDDDDDAVEDVVGVPDVPKEAEGEQLEDHLQHEHAGEHDVADLQNVGQLLGLGPGDDRETLRQTGNGSERERERKRERRES